MHKFDLTPGPSPSQGEGREQARTCFCPRRCRKAEGRIIAGPTLAVSMISAHVGGQRAAGPTAAGFSLPKEMRIGAKSSRRLRGRYEYGMARNATIRWRGLGRARKEPGYAYLRRALQIHR